MILGGASAGAGQSWSYVIAGIGVELLLQGAGGQAQSLPPGRHLYRFQI
jgi:hypothetical protein